MKYFFKINRIIFSEHFNKSTNQKELPNYRIKMNQQHYSKYEEQQQILRQQKRQQEEERRHYEEKHRREHQEIHRRKYEENQRREEKKVTIPPTRVSIPPMRYKLTKLTQAQTLTQIAMKTQGFYSMSTRSADWVQRDVRNREFSSYGSYPAPRDRSITHTIIGEDNYYLKLTMKNHDMDYICYEGDKNEFQFWGEYQCCIRAMNELRYRIEKVQNRMEKDVRTQLQKQWPVSNCSPGPNDDDDEHDDNNNDNYCPSSPTYDYDFEYDIPNANVAPAYSNVAVNQMHKMGFVEGSGLGSKNSGRLNPLNPVDDLGGRSYNHYSGLGFTGQREEQIKVSEPTTTIALDESDAIVETDAVPETDA